MPQCSLPDPAILYVPNPYRRQLLMTTQTQNPKVWRRTTMSDREPRNPVAKLADRSQKIVFWASKYCRNEGTAPQRGIRTARLLAHNMPTISRVETDVGAPTWSSVRMRGKPSQRRCTNDSSEKLAVGILLPIPNLITTTSITISGTAWMFRREHRSVRKKTAMLPQSLRSLSPAWVRFIPQPLAHCPATQTRAGDWCGPNNYHHASPLPPRHLLLHLRPRLMPQLTQKPSSRSKPLMRSRGKSSDSAQGPSKSWLLFKEPQICSLKYPMSQITATDTG